MPIRYETVLVTPSIARKWLGVNSENNRRPKSGRIPNFARDMREGRWEQSTGETIKFDVNGTLIDGQNRLLALIEAGVALEFDVAYDVPPGAMVVIDTGAARTAADALVIRGAGAMRQGVAATVRWVIAWDAGSPMSKGGRIAPTVSEVLAAYGKDPALYDAAAHRGKDCANRGIGVPAPLSVAYILFHRIDPELTHQFFDLLVTGANMPNGHPVLTLRNKLVAYRAQRLTRPESLAACVRAWNAFRDGATLERILITKSGELTNTNFPRPK